MGELAKLDQSIQMLYKVFERYHAKSDTWHCEHCVSQTDIQNLLHIPLKQLTIEDLHNYQWKALTTWGEVSDFKHFLPRMLELIAKSEGSIPVDHCIGSKLGYANLQNWPPLEYHTVVDFLKAWWANELSLIDQCDDIYNCWCDRVDDCLKSLSDALEDITVFLDMWRNSNSVPAIRHLSHFIVKRVDSLVNKKSLGHYIKRQGQIIEFLLDDHTLKKLESFFFRYSDAPFAFEFSEAAKQLEWIRSVLLED